VKEIIKEIKEIDTGYLIITDKQTIDIGISQEQDCCENAGYFMSNDDLKDFVGAELREIKLTDDLLETTVVPDYATIECNTMFVTFETSNGTLQFVAYNDHNGYYGHEAWVKSTQVTEHTVL
jgi:hypothetical protein